MPKNQILTIGLPGSIINRLIATVITVACTIFLTHIAPASEKEFTAGNLRVVVNGQTGVFSLWSNTTLLFENRSNILRGDTRVFTAFADGVEITSPPAPIYEGKKLDGVWIRIKGKTDNGLFSIVRTIVLTPTSIRSTLRVMQGLDDKSTTSVQETISLSKSSFDAAEYKIVGEGH